MLLITKKEFGILVTSMWERHSMLRCYPRWTLHSVHQHSIGIAHWCYQSDRVSCCWIWTCNLSTQVYWIECLALSYWSNSLHRNYHWLCCLSTLDICCYDEGRYHKGTFLATLTIKQAWSSHKLSNLNRYWHSSLSSTFFHWIRICSQGINQFRGFLSVQRIRPIHSSLSLNSSIHSDGLKQHVM